MNALSTEMHCGALVKGSRADLLTGWGKSLRTRGTKEHLGRTVG